MPTRTPTHRKLPYPPTPRQLHRAEVQAMHALQALLPHSPSLQDVYRFSVQLQKTQLTDYSLHRLVEDYIGVPAVVLAIFGTTQFHFRWVADWEKLLSISCYSGHLHHALAAYSDPKRHPLGKHDISQKGWFHIIDGVFANLKTPNNPKGLWDVGALLSVIKAAPKDPSLWDYIVQDRGPYETFKVVFDLAPADHPWQWQRLMEGAAGNAQMMTWVFNKAPQNYPWDWQEIAENCPWAGGMMWLLDHVPEGKLDYAALLRQFLTNPEVYAVVAEHAPDTCFAAP